MAQRRKKHNCSFYGNPQSSACKLISKLLNIQDRLYFEKLLREMDLGWL
jgi:hypothetical protein